MQHSIECSVEWSTKGWMKCSMAHSIECPDATLDGISDMIHGMFNGMFDMFNGMFDEFDGMFDMFNGMFDMFNGMFSEYCFGI